MTGMTGMTEHSIDDVAPGWEAYHASHESRRNSGGRKGGIVANVEMQNGRVVLTIFEPYWKRHGHEVVVDYEVHTIGLAECDPETVRPLRISEASKAAKTFCKAVIANGNNWTGWDEQAFCLAAVLTEPVRELMAADRRRREARQDERAQLCADSGEHCVTRLSEAHTRRGHIGICCDCGVTLEGVAEAGRAARAKRPAWAESL